MLELWEHATLPYNLPLTLLLGVILVYWVLCICGLFGIDMLDGLFGCEGDVSDATPPSGVLQSVLRYLNATEVPLIMVLSLLSLYLWTIAVIGNFFLNPGQSELLAGILIFPNLVVSLILVKVTTKPLAPLMRKMKAHTLTHIDLKGRTGKIRTGDINEKFGQVQLDGDSDYLINAHLPEGHEPLPRHTEVLVIGGPDENGLYVVRPLDKGDAEEVSNI